MLLIYVLWCSGRVQAQHEERQAVGYPELEGDITWDARNVVMYPVLACAAGAMGGMLGIGGGGSP